MKSVPITCGVALCTFNGALYLQRQLDSILGQSRKLDAIAICDDASSDGTWALLKQFAESSPVPVTLYRQPTQLGVTKNFETAVKTLDTDIIFLCDQDDVWLPEKVATMLGSLESEPLVQLINTDAILVDASEKSLGVNLFKALRVASKEQAAVASSEAFATLCRRNLITGATTAFRRELLDIALPFPDSWLHDEWLGIMAAATSQIRLLNPATTLYRQHDGNALGAQVPNVWNKARLLLKVLDSPTGGFQSTRPVRMNALLERLCVAPSTSPHCIDIARQALMHATFRASLPAKAWRRTSLVWHAVRKGHYAKFTNGFYGILRDILNR